MGLSQTTISAILVICSILVFVPIYYVYPSRTLKFRRLSLAVSGIWLLCYALILLGMPSPQQLLITISLLCMLYYVGLSLYMTYLRYTHKLQPAEHS
jgi:phosphatidylcholine synthase